MTPKKRFIFVFILVLSFAMGVLGGFLGALGLSWLGISEIKPVEIPTFKTEKIVLEESSAVIEVAKKVTPAVVSITSKRTLADIFGNLAEQKGGGTGFIITSDGLVVTNKHVVADEKASYMVFTQDGENFSATIKAKDPFNDLAVLKIDANSLPVVELGDSDRLEIGQQVVAIGNALGEFQNSVTTGVISAKERKIEVEDGSTLEGLLQTDAAINPGKSGGPLVNLKGQVVGINTAVAAKGIAEGIGFALPINTVKTGLDGVQKTGKIKRPFLGVRYLPVTKEVKEAADLSVDFGVLIYSDNPRAPAVVPGSPADKAGVIKNDIITHINNEKIDEKKGLARLIQQYQPGDEVELTIVRDKREFKLKVKLGEFE
ncbi:trypsin-like peptidase domain-containing protein [Candidatus Berkelbacteria bacterium]|nr:trypsin-like peptidase domain-containing protein [Candidatus Berkelbacteria bacterium]